MNDSAFSIALDGKSKVKSITWNDAYLNQAEEKFDIIIQEIYEDEFIDKIFEDYVTTISRDKFIRAISADNSYLSDLDLNPFDGIHLPSGRKGECTWLFQPSKIRSIFKKYIKA